ARAVAVAGAPLPPEIAERWETTTGIPISSFYGSMDAGQLAVASPSDPQDKRWTTVGRPHDLAEWKILDPAGGPVATGQVGEVCMRGDLVQQRYWGEDFGPFAADAGKDELDAFLGRRGLAHYKWPVAVHAVDELPLSGPGKVNRSALREMADARAV